MSTNRQAQAVRVPELDSRPRLEPTAFISAGDGGGQYFARTERMWASLSEDIGKLADTAATIEGRTAGAEAGMSQEFRPTRHFSLRARAYDDAGIDAYRLTMRTRIAEETKRITSQFGADPVRLKAAFDELRVKETDGFPEIKPEATAMIARAEFAAQRSAVRTVAGNAHKAHVEALEKSLEARFSLIDRQASVLGLDAEADKKISAELDQLRVDVRTAQTQGYIKQKTADTVIAKAEGIVVHSRIVGAFERLPDLETRQKFFENFVDQYSKGVDAFGKIDPQTFHSVRNTMTSALKTETVAITSNNNRVIGEIDAIEKQLTQSGIQPPQDQVQALRARVASTSDPVLASRLQRTEAILTLSEQLKKSSVPEAEAELTRIDKLIEQKGATPDALAARGAVAGIVKRMKEEVSTNPLGWADRTGLAPFPPIDFSADGAIHQLRNRVAQAETIAQHYGVSTQYLLPQERTALERIASKGGEDLIKVSRFIADAASDRAPLVLREIGVQSPVVAHLGMLTRDGRGEDFALDVAEALKVRADPEAKLPKWFTERPPEKVQTAQLKVSRDLFGTAFALVPQTQRQIELSASAAFQSRALRRGLDPALTGDGALTTFSRTLQEAAGANFTADGTQFGGVTKITGGFFSSRPSTQVLVPANVRADQFGAVLNAITDADLKALEMPPVAPDGKAYTARDLQRARPIAVPGGYRFALGDLEGDPKWMRGQDGQPFVLPFYSLEETLRARVPNAFRGGR
jgi:hypothetical protein